MLRRYWLLLALVLPFLALSAGDAGSGFASDAPVDCQLPDAPCVAGQPFDERHAIVSDASESADEEGPPEKFARANPVVLRTPQVRAGLGDRIAPSCFNKAPIIHAARPRAPPHSL